jgi:proline iminopeptidase
MRRPAVANLVRHGLVVPLLIQAIACGSPAPAETPPDPRATDSGYVGVADARLFYRSVGTRDPIIVVHGGPGMDHTYLLPGMLGLSRRHRVIYYDQRGSGRTQGDVSAATVSFDHFLSDIDAIIDSLKLGKPTLLGHSWGGLVAMRYAAKRPDRLRALVLMNTVEPGRRYAAESARMLRAKQTTEDTAEISRLARTPELQRRDTSAVNAIFRVMFRSTFADRTLADRLVLSLDPRTARNMGAIATHVMGSLGSTDVWSEIASIKVPTLIVQGEADAMPLAMLRELSRTIPQAELRVISGAGHFPYIEKPSETFTAISSFLARVKTTPGASLDGKVPFAIPRRP